MKQVESHKCIFKLELEDIRVLYVVMYVNDTLMMTNDHGQHQYDIVKRNFLDIKTNIRNKRNNQV